MYEIFFKTPAKKFFKKLDNRIQNQLLSKINKLKTNPRLGKPLVGNFMGLWSLRIGKYRALYEIKESELIIYVLNIGHRKKIYD